MVDYLDQPTAANQDPKTHKGMQWLFTLWQIVRQWNSPPALNGSALHGPSRFFTGTGVPSNSAGADHDFYFRSDGSPGATIYQRRSGAWVAVA